MRNIYYVAITAYDEEVIRLGLDIAKDMAKNHDSVLDFSYLERTLVYTGWASNSYRILVASHKMNKSESLLYKLSEKFNSILCKHYGVKDIQEIQFDDETFEEEFKELREYMEKEFNVIELDKNCYKLLPK